MEHNWHRHRLTAAEPFWFAEHTALAPFAVEKAAIVSLSPSAVDKNPETENEKKIGSRTGGE